MHLRSRHPIRTFVAGLLALLPLAATLALLVWTARILSSWLGPESLVGSLLTRLGLGLTGSDAAGYALGVLLLALGVYLFGLLVETELQRGLARAFDAVMQKIPVVRTVYDVAQKLVALVGPGKRDGMPTMKPVWLHFGGPPAPGEPAASTVVLGLLSTPVPVLIGGQAFHGVLVPTAPVPVGGGLMYVPAHWVVPADVGMEALTSIYVSMGVTSGQYLETMKK